MPNLIVATVEDGALVDGANTFATELEAIDYARDRGLNSFNDEADARRCLIIAMDYLKSIDDWAGYKTFTGQLIPFPRVGISYYAVTGFPCHKQFYDKDTVPENIKTAQIELAIAVGIGIVLINNTGKLLKYDEPQIKKDKTGPLETEYFEDKFPTVEKLGLPYVESLLAPYRKPRKFGVTRA